MRSAAVLGCSFLRRHILGYRNFHPSIPPRKTLYSQSGLALSIRGKTLPNLCLPLCLNIYLFYFRKVI